MVELIHGWEPGKLDDKWTPAMKAEFLREVAIAFPDYGKHPKSPRVVAACDRIARGMLERHSARKHPWALLMSESNLLLQTFAKIIPVTVSLTMDMRPMVVSTDQVSEALRFPKPRDDFETDPAGELLHKMGVRGMLVWEDFCTKKRGLNQYEATIKRILSQRQHKRLFTLFTCSFYGDGTRDSATLLQTIEDSMGMAVVLMLREAATFHQFSLGGSANQFTVHKEKL